MSAFSDFIRNATPEEKERVYTEVMSRAIKEQADVFRRRLGMWRSEARKLGDVFQIETGRANDWSLSACLAFIEACKRLEIREYTADGDKSDTTNG